MHAAAHFACRAPLLSFHSLFGMRHSYIYRSYVHRQSVTTTISYTDTNKVDKAFIEQYHLKPFKHKNSVNPSQRHHHYDILLYSRVTCQFNHCIASCFRPNLSRRKPKIKITHTTSAPHASSPQTKFRILDEESSVQYCTMVFCCILLSCCLLLDRDDGTTTILQIRIIRYTTSKVQRD
jgi:hypothetical protein